MFVYGGASDALVAIVVAVGSAIGDAIRMPIGGLVRCWAHIGGVGGCSPVSACSSKAFTVLRVPWEWDVCWGMSGGWSEEGWNAKSKFLYCMARRVSQCNEQWGWKSDVRLMRTDYASDEMKCFPLGRIDPFLRFWLACGWSRCDSKSLQPFRLGLLIIRTSS